MLDSNNVTMLRYEFIIYFNIIENAILYKIKNILLTEDDLANSLCENNINWVQVDNIDVIDDNIVYENHASENKEKICGLFVAKPINWKYAKIIVDDSTNTKHIDSITKMPKSPIIPVIFDIKS